MSELRELEANAGRHYWQARAPVPIHFDNSWRGGVPAHWRQAGSRTPPRGVWKRAKGALTPAHAMINYAYAVLETEATIALQARGFDPSLGIMHTDKRYRRSLASDVMEVARPAADELVLDLLERRALRRSDVVETRQGVCRLGSPLTRELASWSQQTRPGG